MQLLMHLLATPFMLTYMLHTLLPWGAHPR
jgi:hypothetical protein